MNTLADFVHNGLSGAVTAQVNPGSGFSNPGGSFWMPPQANEYAARVDGLFYFILIGCTVFFILTMAAMVAFVIQYRRKGDTDHPTARITHNTAVELVWSGIPAILLVIVFGWGFKDWMALNVPPGNALDIRVTGVKWSWSFDYPKDGISSPDLVVPAGRDVKLTMVSQDDLHSFYIPTARIKRDVIPNRYTVLHFRIEQPGEHQILCTEYCGTAHSKMLARVKVLPDDQYKEWIDSGGGMGGKDMPLAQLGEIVYNKLGCAACHTLDGNKLVGPSFKGSYGVERKLADGSSAVMDDNYIRESIMTPMAKVVDGYAPVMPSYQGRLKDQQVAALIEFIKAKKD